MLIKTLLNDCYPVKLFVYGKISLTGKVISVEISSRKGSRGLCSDCGCESPGYDQLKERRFKFIPLWGYDVEFIYRPRRVQCPKHGVIVERLPWADSKSPICEPLKIFLAYWAKMLSWDATAREFRVSWRNVFESVEYVVEYGLKHRILTGINAIGVDEIQYQVGHKYLTLVYQIDADCRRLLFVGKDRTAKTLLRFFYRFKGHTDQIKTVCSDLWKPYLKVIKRKLKNSVHILDRFHVAQYLNFAVDQTRREEAAQIKRDGYEPILERARWCLLKGKKRQKASQLAKLKDLLKYNLKTVRCYLLKEAFQHFWTYKTRWGAKRFLDVWLERAMRSRLPEIQKVAKRLRKHQELLLNYFAVKERLSNGPVEGLNLKAKLAMRKAYGFRKFKTIELALYHQLGNLPTPTLTHRFC
jgi:transposase